MIVIHGEENVARIDDRYTVFELETMLVKKGMDPITNYAIVGPDDIGLDGILKLKQYIPLHEALMKNYKEKNFDFCLESIGHLKGNVGTFMDTFYSILASRIKKQQEDPKPGWTHILDVS